MERRRARFAARWGGAERSLGAVVTLFAAVLLLVWIPADVGSSLVERIRRHTVIGDALAPTVAGIILLGAGVRLMLPRRAGAAPRDPDHAPTLSLASCGYLAMLLVIFAVSLALMRYAGPFAAWAMSALGAVYSADGGAAPYRLLRDLVPWKYLGYVSGGGAFIYALSALADGRYGLSRLALALGIALGFALLCDLPFDDLLLPPAGDV